MGIQNPGHQDVQQLAIVPKHHVDIGCESTSSVVFFHHSARDVLGLFAMGNCCFELFAFRKLPNPIGLQVPERQLGVRCLSRRTEVAQERSQLRVDIFEQHEPVITALKSRERQQQKQRLVRRAFIASLPYVDVESFEEILVRSHLAPLCTTEPGISRMVCPAFRLHQLSRDIRAAPRHFHADDAPRGASPGKSSPPQPTLSRLLLMATRPHESSDAVG